MKIGPLELTLYTQDDAAYKEKRANLPPPGRCADRIEDFFFVLRGGWNSSWDELHTAFSNMRECYASDDGDEPRARYVRLAPDSPLWKDHAARPTKFARLRAQQEEERQQQLQLQRQQQQAAQQQAEQQQRSRLAWLWWWRRPGAAMADAAAAADA